jgi:LYR motif-containing protein 4
VKELAVIKRSAIVNSLYGGWKLVVEQKKPQATLERGDT